MTQDKTRKLKRGPKDPKRGPLPTGNKLIGRAAAVCSIAEELAFKDAAKNQGITLAKWARKALVAALSPVVKKRLHKPSEVISKERRYQ